MKMKFLYSKRIIIITIVLAIIVISLLGLIKLNNIVNEKELKESFEIVNELDRYFDNKIAMADFVTEATFYKDFLLEIDDRESYRENIKYPKIIRDLNLIRDIDGRILNAFFSSVKLEILITHDEWVTPIDYDIDKREWYIELLKSNGTDISTPYIDAITGEYIITVSKAIYSDFGDLLGSLGLDIKVGDIGSIVSNYSLEDKIIIVDKSGDIILNTLGNNLTNIEMVKINSINDDDDEFKTIKIRGNDFSIHDLDKMGWYLIIMSSRSAFINSDSIFILSGMIIVCLVILMLISLLHVRKNNVRIGEIENQFSKNLESKYSKQLLAKGDRFDKLIEILNVYIDKNKNVSETYNSKMKEKDDQISRSIEVLSEIENKIFESDSLVEMGSIIADIAHEVNTPLGNSILGVSYIKNEVKNLKGIDPKNIPDAINNMEKSIEFTETGLKKTAKLINHFKKIVNSEKYNKKVEFKVVYIIEQLIDNLVGKYPKLNNYDIDISSDSEISIYDNPDAYKEIFRNLIENSMIHGYANKDFGKITIFLTQDNKDLVIIYDDDGIGMVKEVSSKVFKPFFSTKRSEGHLGLGMFIVYNLIESRCKGKIICDSTIGVGTEYKIRIPLIKE